MPDQLALLSLLAAGVLAGVHLAAGTLTMIQATPRSR